MRKTKPNSALKMALGQLYTNKVQDSVLLDLFVNVPREAYVPPNLKDSAYVDEDLIVAPGRTLLAPITLGRMLEEVQILPNQRVLVIGCLQGYVAALAAKLGAKVVAIESSGELVDAACRNLKQQHVGNVEIHQVKSLAEGYSLAAPYDAIFIAGAVQHIPAELINQLTVGGRLVTVTSQVTRPGTPIAMGQALLVLKTTAGLSERILFDAATGLLPGFEITKKFTL
jgi:protein-L-isoaspartate(D-aspartate) O-methyltransferase